MKKNLALHSKLCAAIKGRQLIALLLVCVMIFSLNACSEKNGTTGKAEKEVIFELRNVSGAPMVLESSSDPDYWADLDGITAADFTRDTGVVFSRRLDAEALIQSGSIIETSTTTYEMTSYYAAGAVPEEEQYLYLAPVWKELHPEAMGEIYKVTISGTYNKLAVVEWDGSAFTQIE